MQFNLAPLTAWRGIAILWCIHRSTRQHGPPSLWQFFRRKPSPHVSFARRAQRHSFQVVEWPRGRDLQIMRRSVIGIIRIYNWMPHEAIEKDDVKSFQSALIQILRGTLNGGHYNWRFVFSTNIMLFQNHTLTQWLRAIQYMSWIKHRKKAYVNGDATRKTYVWFDIFSIPQFSRRL